MVNFIENRGASVCPPRTHRNEFPAEYSLAGCSPAWPASASSAGFILHLFISFAKLFSANGNRRIYNLSQERAQGRASAFFTPPQRTTPWSASA
jgi:hypothetical protein